MANNENKAAEFVSVINAQADARCERIKKGTDKYIEYELNRTRKIAAENAKRVAKVEVNKLSEESNTDSYKSRNEMMTRIVSKRDEIADRVFSAVEKRVRDFTEGCDYQAFLENSVKEIIGVIGEETVIYIRPEDKKYIPCLSDLCKGVELDKTIRLGGCKGVNEVRAMRADDTLDSRFEQQKQEFYSASGLSVIGG